MVSATEAGCNVPLRVTVGLVEPMSSKTTLSPSPKIAGVKPSSQVVALLFHKLPAPSPVQVKVGLIRLLTTKSTSVAVRLSAAPRPTPGEPSSWRVDGPPDRVVQVISL